MIGVVRVIAENYGETTTSRGIQLNRRFKTENEHCNIS